jgi:hypothetical protein
LVGAVQKYLSRAFHEMNSSSCATKYLSNAKKQCF